MKKKWICLLTALALAVGACAVKPVISGAAPAEPINLETKNSLTINPYDYNNAEAKDRWEKTDGMSSAHIQVDLYKIAGAVKEGGYDTYSLVPAFDYSSLPISKYSDLQGMKAADWDKLAQDAAKIALGSEVAASNYVAQQELKGTGAVFSNLEPGLYLAVTRGSDLSFGKYIKTMEEEVAEDGTTKTVEKLYTIANSARYEYAFLPQLIALPTKAADANGEINTANPGPWLYSMTTIPKVEETDRYGSLRIVKTLSEYETEAGIAKPEPTTFVFEITATLDGETVFHTFESISFTAGGTESVTIDHIPATADVTVTEVYTGSSYEISGPAVRDGITITADDVVDAPFTNVYNGDRKKGYGIKNQFDFNGDTWVHSPVTPDDEQDRPSLRPGTGTPTQPGGEENPDGEQNGPGEGEQVPPVGQGTETPGQNMTTQPEGQPIE